MVETERTKNRSKIATHSGNNEGFDNFRSRSSDGRISFTRSVSQTFADSFRISIPRTLWRSSDATS